MDPFIRLKILQEGQANGIGRTCEKYNISRTIYYRWQKRYGQEGIGGLKNVVRSFTPKNKTQPHLVETLLNLVRKYPTYGPRALKYLLEDADIRISESAVYNVLKRHHLNHAKARHRFAKTGSVVKKSSTYVPLTQGIKSGEAWLFFTTPLGFYNNFGDLVLLSVIDIKSQIACSRLYHTPSLDNLKDLLTGVAFPIAQSLKLDPKFFIPVSKPPLPDTQDETFQTTLLTWFHDYGLEVQIQYLDDHYRTLYGLNLVKDYTKKCLAYLIPELSEQTDFISLKRDFQDYIRSYNLDISTPYDGTLLSPTAYHQKETGSQIILPLWAYMDRDY